MKALASIVIFLSMLAAFMATSLPLARRIGVDWGRHVFMPRDEQGPIVQDRPKGMHWFDANPGRRQSIDFRP